VAAQRQVGSGPGFDRHQGQLVQPRPFGIKKARIGEVGQRLAAPQPERFAQGGGRVRCLARLRQPASLGHQLLETDDVDVVGTGVQGVAGFGGEDRRRPEDAAQLADLGLQGVGRVGRLPVAPQHVDQPVGADRLPRPQRQQGQQRPLLGVFGIAEGSFAEYARARAGKLAPKPSILTFAQAAAVPVSGLTALQAVRDRGHVQAGQQVLVIGASGGVGTFAVQIAKAYGADVTGVCSTAKADVVKSIGADRVIDYTREDIADGGQRQAKRHGRPSR
jgi:hypothetical protein